VAVERMLSAGTTFDGAGLREFRAAVRRTTLQACADVLGPGEA
jgi:hypothetical protein